MYGPGETLEIHTASPLPIEISRRLLKRAQEGAHEDRNGDHTVGHGFSHGAAREASEAKRAPTSTGTDLDLSGECAHGVLSRTLCPSFVIDGRASVAFPESTLEVVVSLLHTSDHVLHFTRTT